MQGVANGREKGVGHSRCYKHHAKPLKDLRACWRRDNSCGNFANNKKYPKA